MCFNHKTIRQCTNFNLSLRLLHDPGPAPAVTNFFQVNTQPQFRVLTSKLYSFLLRILVEDCVEWFKKMRRQSSHWISYVFCCVYQFLGLCFALKVAPLAFQKVMHHVLGGLESEHVLIYLDDCLILTSSLDKHLETIEKVCYCFKNAGLILRPDKCHFFLDNINFWDSSLSREFNLDTNDWQQSEITPYQWYGKGSDHFWDFAHLYFYVLDIKLLRYHWANCLNRSDTFRIPLPNLLFKLMSMSDVITCSETPILATQLTYSLYWLMLLILDWLVFYYKLLIMGSNMQSRRQKHLTKTEGN